MKFTEVGSSSHEKVYSKVIWEGEVIDILNADENGIIKVRIPELDKNLQDDDWLNTNLGITFLVLSNNKILFNSAIKDCNLPLLKQLEAKQFDICFIDITYGGFFNQGLTCMILETRREGLLENYF